jgi:DNA-binding GntR family transcriptional regulator
METLVPSPSLKDVLYHRIKALLLGGQLVQGQIYSAQHFADLFGSSRTPAREALLRLTGENFLVCLDVRGFKVREFTSKEIQDVFEMRRMIEVHVMRRMVEAGASEDVRKLDASLKSMRAHAAKNDLMAFLEADREFHMVAVQRADNKFLAATIDHIRNNITVFGQRALEKEGRFDEVLAEHAAVLAAVRKRDEARTVEAMLKHLANSEASLVANLRGA